MNRLRHLVTILSSTGILLASIGCSTTPRIEPGDSPDAVLAKMGEPDERYFLEGGAEQIWIWRPFFGGERMVSFRDARAELYSPAMVVADPRRELSIEAR